MQLARSIFKGETVPFCFTSDFMGGWNVNLMARVTAVILDHEEALGMECERDENTK